MKTAKEIRKIQKNAVQEQLEYKLVHMAKNGYTSYCCTSMDCPEWLQEKLVNKGFKVENNINSYGITIYW